MGRFWLQLQPESRCKHVPTKRMCVCVCVLGCWSALSLYLILAGCGRASLEIRNSAMKTPHYHDCTVQDYVNQCEACRVKALYC
jgi:hypothetical protein